MCLFTPPCSHLCWAGPAGTYEWWDAEGELTKIVGGQTVLAVADAPFVENTYNRARGSNA